MSIVTDGLLIATCLTAAFYCFILSRRLTRFSDTESGIGQQIAQLNAILEETRATTKETNSGAKALSERLSRDLAGAKKITQDLAAMIERAEATLDRDFELQTKPQRPERQAEAVPKQQPIATPEEEPPTAPAADIDDSASPIEEQSHDDIAARDFDLADARGEPQLGFLPNVTDTSSISDLSLDGADGADDAESPPPGTPNEDSESLLKVERMAL